MSRVVERRERRVYGNGVHCPHQQQRDLTGNIQTGTQSKQSKGTQPYKDFHRGKQRQPSERLEFRLANHLLKNRSGRGIKGKDHGLPLCMSDPIHPTPVS